MRSTCHIFLLGLGLVVTLSAWGQTSGKKPPRKEEEEEPVQVKPKAPLRVDDDSPARSAAPRPADLAAEAEQAGHPALRDLLRLLAIPHDLVTWSSTGNTKRIEPQPRRITPATTDLKANLRIYPQDDKGKRGSAFTASRGDIKQIESYEEIALKQVQRFLDPKGPAKSLSRFEALQSAERVLSVVVRYHESARSRGLREGDAWDEPLRLLRAELQRVQIEILGIVVTDKDWDLAYAMAGRLAERYRQPEAQSRIAQQMARFLVQSLQAEKYGEARLRMKLLEDLFPHATLTGPTADTLARKAAELFDLARAEKDQAKALALLTTAESIWPRLPGLRDERLRRSNAYPILHVGVRTLPELLSPAAACTDTERQAVELLFESLLQAVHEPGVGQRYVPELAASPPRLIPLGREFQLARDAFWSDGSPVTAVDVRSTVRLLRAQDRSQERGRPLLDEARIGGDPYHVTLVLSQGLLDPLALMTFKIVPESARLERLDDARFARRPIGSGPFLLQGRDQDEVRFVANHNYRRADKPGLPRIREVRFYRPKDPAGDFAAGRLQLLLDPETIPSVRSVPRVSVHALPNRRIYFLAVNHRRPLLQEKDLRRALALALDRSKILDDVFRAPYKDDQPPPHRPLNGPFPPGSWAAKPDLKSDTCCDPARARILAEHLKNLPHTPLTLKFPNDDPRVARACAAIREQVCALGVELQLEPRSPAQLRRDVEIDHNYDLAYYHHDYDSEAYLLWPLFDPDGVDHGRNFLGYHNDSDLLTLLHKAKDHRDFARVRECTHALHALFCDKMPFIPLWQLDTHIALHDDLKTHPSPRHLDPLRIFTSVERWELDRVK